MPLGRRYYVKCDNNFLHVADWLPDGGKSMFINNINQWILNLRQFARKITIDKMT